MANGVFSGGGVKGIAFVGAVQACEEQGIEWQSLAGTSAGSMIAALLAAGYTAKELRALLRSFDYAKIVSRSSWEKFALTRTFRFLFKKGLHSGSYLQWWMDQQLAKKKVRTFADLPEGKLHIVVTNLSSGKLEVFPDAAPQYGIDPRQLKISQVVRMSCGIPYYFDPVMLKRKGKNHYLVDGGVISNFPIWIFDKASSARMPTYGFMLKGETQERYFPIFGPISMLGAIISVMLQNQDQIYLEKQAAVRTITIPASQISPIQFILDRKDQDYLYECGYQAARKFFENQA